MASVQRSNPTCDQRPGIPLSDLFHLSALSSFAVNSPGIPRVKATPRNQASIVECEIIQWFVEPGARVEEFSPLCEVQSDKASVEITSRFAGVVKKLHYDAGEMAKVGKPFVDIDIEGDVKAEDIGAAVPPEDPRKEAEVKPAQAPVRSAAEETAAAQVAVLAGQETQGTPKVKGKHATLATPAAMTRSLSIPHFLYADEVDFTSLVELRGRLNRVLAKSGLSDSQVGKLSYLPFIIKAVSMSLYKYPTLNARVDADSASGKPSLVLRSQHNIGVAMDTPSGLLVPVVKNVGALNILGIAAELARLQALAVAGRLAPQDMAGGTITVSNIGSIGGTYLSPVVVEREVAILGVGRMRTVPAFSTVPGEEDRVVKRQVCNFSWSADHRVVDGATMARAAEVVRAIVEEPDVMVMHLR
ncbi:hypothetical protein CHGG_02811 [Chaetomium globosum CBS 148.51]|uniref:Dihydrolipoamide acetyltransferase component of pyruvate dehydrogenase complex n=1 Tax=Chaetomium globosum (strain ATCC 6205 / CBS 148.51 / DSM 1962 / NBRC 6347 / NRRL 1970) TaxID=306901 RepID=Q2HAE3_CHAGB|nr:uncharacterized protein CHGG_02811 [Chaetomium globosum CBS 148.51]EAQ90876.1 hypothetical protein CHGG_02811 [Chaetomium globosum CBS 148.51]